MGDSRNSLSWGPFAFLAAFVVTIVSCLVAGGMASVVAWLVLISTAPLVGAGFLAGVAVRFAWKRRMTRTRVATATIATLLLTPLAWTSGFWPMAFPSSAANEPPLQIRVPTDLPMRVAWGGDAPRFNQHALMPDQRWAYDLVVEPTDLTGETLEDYGCYGVPVVAPIAGRIVQMENEQPDQAPGKLIPNPEAPLGNHVVIEPARGGFLLIAHLAPGSVHVSVGEQVAEGDLLGTCGNSGNTSGAHVHIHYQRQDPRVHPIHLAEGLPLVFHHLKGPREPRGGIEITGGVARLIGDEIRHRPGEAKD